MKAELIEKGYSTLLENFNNKYFLSKGSEYLHHTMERELSLMNEYMTKNKPMKSTFLHLYIYCFSL